MPSKGKTRHEKQKKRGGEKAKSKSQDWWVTFKPQNYPDISLSVHAQTLQTNILHLDQKATKCRTCKRLCGTFYLFIAQQWPENRLTNFKMHFLAKSPGVNELMTNLFIGRGCFINFPLSAHQLLHITLHWTDFLPARFLITSCSRWGWNYMWCWNWTLFFRWNRKLSWWGRWCLFCSYLMTMFGSKQGIRKIQI